MNRSREALAALLIFGAVLAIYGRRLVVSSVALHPDETALVLQARAIADTGRDIDGHLLPLYFRLHDNVWTTPVPVYFTALVLTTIGWAESGARLPSVIIAAFDVALIFLVAGRLFGGWRPAVVAAAMLALTPAHFIHGRLALASVYPVAFILSWLLWLIAYVQRRQTVALFAATLSLGVGFYAHPSSVLTMPASVVLTALTVLAVRGSLSQYAVASAGFIAPLLVLVPWFYWHHDIFRFTLGDWGFHTLANPRDGLRYSVFSWPTLATRSTVYWGFFSPSYLFFSGGADLVSSTRQAGVFLGLTAIPLLYGIFHLVKSRWADPIWRLILIAFALSPVAAATFTDPKAAGRALGMLPLGVLIAVAGVELLFSNRQRTIRLAGIAVLVLLPLQFYRFYDDYFTQYPQRVNAAVRQSGPSE